ncbi:phosphate/phosphite/phosphonate ABC transporter substrate-binding protein [Alkalihalobacillus sp. AL-G]|uniref:phosphate/phosphite/phosphonate ABC transporter substrate-binding protein n=1 Tax=Alkalihalobacillus sp. AL-G TaxID=2926399 RepID=UPI00272C35D0|nr:phosphate/phosphite/phosphonate ABC transporter substrate-binding protein [Alkalihalobacillus sp. AL-G]WLD95266.1 phosphate/phosphite/phosphonate ABC transporter substrate-binding protein [Alkalihalobacillus sp. AL-G]
MKKVTSILFAVILLVALAACGGGNSDGASGDGDKEKLTIGVIPAQTEGEMQGAMDKLQKLLSDELDRSVSIETYPDYNGVVEAMNYDNIDMAFFGPLTYVIAHEKSGAKAIITQLVDGEPFYHSFMITHKDTPYESLDDIVKNSKKVDFAFGDPSSTSGSLIPSIELKDRGVYTSQSDHEFKTIRFTGSHDATALSIQNQEVTVGAIDSAIYNQLVESGKIKGDKLKVIWKSEELFQYPWAVNKNMDEDLIKKLQNIFVDIKDEEILNAFGASGFTKASNEDYASIRKAAVKQGIIKE